MPDTSPSRSAGRAFPIQATAGHGYPARSVEWSVAERAYAVYSAMYGTQQSLERLAERGGFDNSELDVFLRMYDEGWHNAHGHSARSHRCDALFMLWHDEHPRRHPSDQSPLAPLWYPALAAVEASNGG